jgi:acyl-CoA synthetase (AMP-forming)/AMP-acid ligase II
MDWDTLTIGEALRRTASRFPKRIALVGADQRISFDELDRAADELAHGLRALGVGRGDHPAFLLRITLAKSVSGKASWDIDSSGSKATIRTKNLSRDEGSSLRQ